ncbi:AVR7 protein, partial [Nycticryphes semicollaris]|nr:AVR7 protein [Nycticryphes semicollaris]
NAQSSLLQCVLTGRWANDLGSNMTIWNVDEGGKFSGLYHTAVGGSPNPIQISPLLGFQ